MRTIYSDEVLMLTAAEMEEWYERELILRAEHELKLNRRIMRRGGLPRTIPLSSFFLLDNLQAKSLLAYSSRKLSSAFPGNAFNVRRSNDNLTQDIGFAVSSDFLSVNLDTNALANFVSSNSGFITQFYDQSGNVNVSTQTTNANQPRVVNAGTNDTINGHVAMHHLATFLNYVSATIPQPFTLCFVGQMSIAAGGEFCDAQLNRLFVGPGGGGNWQIFAGGALSSAVANDSNLHGFIAVFNGVSSRLVLDGAQIIAPGNASTNSWQSGEFIGAGFGPAGITGFIPEMIILNSAIGSIDITTIETSWRSYWGTP